MTIVIQKPLENILIKGKHTRAVGISDYRYSQEGDPIIFEIAYEYKTDGIVKGKRQFPHKYKISKADIKLYGIRRQVGDKEGYVVPIENMTEIQTFTHREHGVMTGKCRYCKDTFEYYTGNEPINCLKAECVKKAIDDGIYKDHISRQKQEVLKYESN